MKLRPFLILLLFVVSTGILVWLYYAATRRPKAPRSSPWAQTIADLDACGRRKHVTAAQYDHYADIADREQRPDAARLFRAMAYSSRLQEHNCATAIVRLGGSYHAPQKAVVFRGTTDDNIARSLDYGQQHLDDRFREPIDRALNRSNRYAARALIWASAGEMKHLALLERYRHKHPQDNVGYRLCPVCGNLYETRYQDIYCPFCLTSSRAFIPF